jgi:diaminopimelate decarboxylase
VIPKPEIYLEPGRGLVGEAGILISEIVFDFQKIKTRLEALDLHGCRDFQRSDGDAGRVHQIPGPIPRKTAKPAM